MRRLLLIVCCFFFIFPIFLKYLPIPFDRVLQLLGMATMLVYPKFARKFLLNKSIFVVFGINLIIVAISVIAMLNGTGAIDSYFVKSTLDIYFYFFSALFIVFLFEKRYKENFSIVKILDVLVTVFVIQAIISILFFVLPTVFQFYLSTLNEGTNQALFERTHLLNKRFIGIGSAFFSGVVKYGYVFLIMIILPYCKESVFFGKSLRYFLALLVISIAGMLTGRFFFLAIALGMAMAVLIDRQNLFRFIYKGVPIILLCVSAFYFAGASMLGPERFEVVFNFVFELFINFYNSGELATSSSDATLNMYIFPNDLSTWLIGDGKMMADGGSYYMGSDVGFVRLIFYFGIIATILYFLIHYYYYRVLIKSTGSILLKTLFFFMFLWVLVYHAKGLASSNEFLMLLILGSIAHKSVRIKYKIGY